jgi:hypothetical protein
MWNEGASPRVLDSEAMVMEAAENNEITLTEIDVVLNMPQIKFLISIQKR